MKRLVALCALALVLLLFVSSAQAGEVVPATPLEITAPLTETHWSGSEPLGPERAPAQGAAGTIAYVQPNDTTGDEIWLVEPNGTNSRKIYSVNKPDPYGVQAITDLAWRPDAGTLAFASNHEDACSWLASDIYAILADGSGYRRVTNAPHCAALAGYPKGSVTVGVSGSGLYLVYIQGAPGLQFAHGGDAVEFTNVADLGNVFQPAVAIDGESRWMGGGANVKTGQMVDGGTVDASDSGAVDYGAYKLSWNRDGSRIGYSMRCSRLYGIPATPPIGSIGTPLLNASDVFPCVMTWGATPATANQILYFTPVGDPGIFLTTEGSANAGTKLVSAENYDNVFDLHYLPDGSGFIYTMTSYFRSAANVYRYDFQSGKSTPLTSFGDKYARSFSISPDGQKIVFGRTAEFFSEYDASQLWMVGIDGSNLQLFASNGAHPTWSPGAVQTLKKLYLPLIRR